MVHLGSTPGGATIYTIHMQKALWVVEFQSANYCGAEQYCLVWATSENNAHDEASSWVEEVFYEQDSEQYLEENGEDPEAYAYITNVYPLVSEEAEDIRRYLKDETQKQFYPIVN